MCGTLKNRRDIMCQQKQIYGLTHTWAFGYGNPGLTGTTGESIGTTLDHSCLTS